VITKGAEEPSHHRRVVQSTTSARDAICQFVSGLQLGRPPRVLVPAYYGWSSTEGSGVMDPLRRAGATVKLVRVDRSLHVDVDDFGGALRSFEPDVVMPIHYFGWCDPEISALVTKARGAGALVLEDEAHSMVSCIRGSPSPALGDASALSLHKSLPVPSGGVLLDRRVHQTSPRSPQTDSVMLDFDLPAIADSRRRNARLIMAEITEKCSTALPLRSSIPDRVVPLNVPILVPPNKRQEVYLEMNRMGFGVVSLYHTLGPGIDEETHPDSHWLSARLVNLPCHQDVDEDEIPPMVAALTRVLATR
jgi:dTDP-4-amino-4,6-dideoxygalactose transaminase